MAFLISEIPPATQKLHSTGKAVFPSLHAVTLPVHVALDNLKLAWKFRSYLPKAKKHLVRLNLLFPQWENIRQI